MLAFVVLVSFANAVIVLWGQPWWLLLAYAVVVAAAALAIGVVSRSWLPKRCTYATAGARLAIQARSRGWYVADHVARPGTRGEGHLLRSQISAALVAQADAQHVVVYAHTTSDTLARAYMADIPGMRIAPSRGRSILLVRPPSPLATH